MRFLQDQKWIVFVLPGFVSLFVASFISDFPHIRDSQLPIVYVALTALSVSVPLIVVHFYGRIMRKSLPLDSCIRSPYVLSGIFIFSIFLGMAFGIAHTTDYVSRGLRSIFGKDIVLTSSHSELIKVLFKNAYNEKFIDGQPHIKEKHKYTNRYARFNFSGDRQPYEGVIAAFFGGSDRPQVYLSPACLIEDEKAVPVKGPGVWLNLDKIEDIQFIYDVCSVCATEIEIAAGNSPEVNCPFY